MALARLLVYFLTELSIVAVPGPGGTSSALDGSNRLRSLSWLRDVLPKCVPSIRLVCFSHELQLENGLSISQVERLALRLLDNIREWASDNVRTLLYGFIIINRGPCRKLHGTNIV